MKKIFGIGAQAFFLIIGFIGFIGCQAGTRDIAQDTPANFGPDASYALGMNLGESLKDAEIVPQVEELITGLLDVLFDRPTRISALQAMMELEQAFAAAEEARSGSARDAENSFLARNSQNSGITVTQSGLQYEVIRQGTGPNPSVTDSVLVHYEGSFIDGGIFDSSYNRGEPSQFNLSGLIAGWTEGIQLMNTGSHYRLFVPSGLAYGASGIPSIIPPYSTLIFEVELIEIISN